METKLYARVDESDIKKRTTFRISTAGRILSRMEDQHGQWVVFQSLYIKQEISENIGYPHLTSRTVIIKIVLELWCSVQGAGNMTFT